MPPAVQATCPGCKKTLRIPADWINRKLRCKYCGMVVHAKTELASVKPPNAPASAIPVPPRSAAPASKTTPVAEKSATAEPVPASSLASELAAAAQPLSPMLDDVPIVRVPQRYRRSRFRRWVARLVGLSFLLAALGAAYFFREPLHRLATSVRDLIAENAADSESKKGPAEPHLSAGGVFPRRALVICVNNYLYANPVSYGVQEHNVHALPDRLRRVLHIDPTQFVELSDAASAPPVKPGSAPVEKPAKGKSGTPPAGPSPARLPLKPVIENTISTFLDTCRAQDRILLLFVGHVVEIDGEAFLVPLEGEFKVKETLIPLAWLYERLQKCAARQKVLVMDTCRLDPGRGLERPGSGPMPAKLDALLAKPPRGVQVWSACSAEQYSYEIDGDSLFLAKLYDSLSQPVIGRLQREQDPLPVGPLAEAVSKSTTTTVAAQLKAKQTPRLAGKEADGGVAFNPAEELPPRIEIPEPPPPPGGMARPEEVRSILREIDLPPIKLARSDTATLRIETLVPFSAKKLAPYRADYLSLGEISANPERFPLRVAVLEAVKFLRERFNPQNPALVLRDYFSGNNSDAIKKQILKESEKPADILTDLNALYRRLEKVGEEREQEPSKRWQAHYDYVLAQVLARIAYLEEYALMLGKIRKDELPPLDAGHAGYRLASRERLQSGTEVRARVAASKKLLAKVARQHKGTPWEILAKREQLTTLGLEWQPTR